MESGGTGLELDMHGWVDQQCVTGGLIYGERDATMWDRTRKRSCHLLSASSLRRISSASCALLCKYM